MIKVAVIGAGNISSAHIGGYARFPERCSVVAVCDIYEEKARDAIARHGLKGARPYVDHRDLLASDVDLVSVCTPPFTHAPIAIDFMRAGKNVLVEKPMASSLKECDEMNRVAAETGKTLSVVAQNRFRTPMMRLKAVLDSGLAGKIVHVQVDSFWWRGHCYYDLWWRGTWEKEGGGCTLNHAVHHIDAMLWMAGMPSEVLAVMGNTSHDNAEVEDLSMALLKFPDGVLGQITSSVVHHGEEQQLVFQGREARVSFPWRVSSSKSKPDGFPEPNPALERELQAAYDAVPELPHELHAGQIENVLDALERGSPLLIDGKSGQAALEVIMGIYASAKGGVAVKLPIARTDPFYTREGTQTNAIRFYEKSKSVENF
jgi:predicted dehydrogenase